MKFYPVYSNKLVQHGITLSVKDWMLMLLMRGKATSYAVIPKNQYLTQPYILYIPHLLQKKYFSHVLESLKTLFGLLISPYVRSGTLILLRSSMQNTEGTIKKKVSKQPTIDFI